MKETEVKIFRQGLFKTEVRVIFETIVPSVVFQILFLRIKPY